MIESFRRLSPQEGAAIRPRVIDVVTVHRGDTIDHWLNEWPIATSKSTASGRSMACWQDFARPWSKVKLVVYGTGGASLPRSYM